MTNKMMDPAIHSFWTRVFQPFKTFYQQKTFLVSLGYICLAMSVLGPGAAIISYLVYHDMSAVEIAAFYGSCALFGVSSSFLMPFLNSKLGLAKTGLGSIWAYVLLVSMTLVHFFLLPVIVESKKPSAITDWLLLLVPILFSRLPYWAFENIKAQILHESVQPDDKAVVTEFEWTAFTLVLMISFIPVVAFSTPSYLHYISLISILFCLLAAVFYTIWFIRIGSSVVFQTDQPKPHLVNSDTLDQELDQELDQDLDQ